MSEKKESIELKKGKYPLPLVEINATELLAANEEDYYKWME